MYKKSEKWAVVYKYGRWIEIWYVGTLDEALQYQKEMAADYDTEDVPVDLETASTTEVVLGLAVEEE